MYFRVYKKIHYATAGQHILMLLATDRIIMEKTMLPLFLGFFHLILSILAGNDDMHESLEEFEFRTDWTTDCRVSCP